MERESSVSGIDRNDRLVKSALILVNGDLPRPGYLIQLAKEHDSIICTDGAANKLKESTPKLNPCVIIGDFDSITQKTLSFYQGRAEIIEAKCQEATDLEKALNYSLKLGCQSTTLVGIKGSRYDHTISNLHVLHKALGQLEINIVDDYGYGTLLQSRDLDFEYAIDEPIGTPVSLIPLGAVASITTYGLKYPLREEPLIWGVRSGQSNEISSRPAWIKVHRSITEKRDQTGALLVFVLQNEEP